MDVKKRSGNILVVDDEPHIVVAIEYLMQEAGYQTLTAHNGADALEKLETFTPNLIILDVMMPIMDGFELAHELRKNPNNHGVKIVFLTAKAADQDKLNAYDVGGDVFLSKPFDNDELLQIVEELMVYG